LHPCKTIVKKIRETEAQTDGNTAAGETRVSCRDEGSTYRSNQDLKAIFIPKFRLHLAAAAAAAADAAF
jgi:hypothetical protein